MSRGWAPASARSSHRYSPAYLIALPETVAAGRGLWADHVAARKLAREVYADDPAERFLTRGSGLRDDLLMARMQRQLPSSSSNLRPGQPASSGVAMGHRDLLHRIDHAAGTVEIDGRVHPCVILISRLLTPLHLTNYRLRSAPASNDCASHFSPAPDCGNTCHLWCGVARCGCVEIMR